MTIDAGARSCVMIAMIVTFGVMLPSLAAPTLLGSDDWAMIWVFHNEGPAYLQKYMTQAAHPGLAPILNLLFWLGGENPAHLAHAVAILFHLANGWLLWLIFRQGRDNEAFAASLAVLYLSSPFVAGFDFIFSAVQYDVLIFCYLLSIWLSGSTNPLLFSCAIVSALFGLSFETLIALEPIRWWFLYQQRRNIMGIAWRATPFALIILLIIGLRVIWIHTAGVYFEYNVVRNVDVRTYLDAFVKHLYFFLQAIDSAEYLSGLVQYDSVWWLGFLGAGAIAIGVTAAHLRFQPSYRSLAVLVILGSAVLVAGTLPYDLVGSIPQRSDNSARFALVSQIGALILVGSFVQLLPLVKLRAIALGLAVLVFASVPPQMAKWLLYEELVLRDFRSQVGQYLAGAGEQRLVVQFQPASKQFLYRNRGCLTSYDINVALELASQRHGSFVFDQGCPPSYYSAPDACRFTGYRSERCPSRRQSAEFRLNPDMERFDRLQLADLVRRVLFGLPLAAGRLIIERDAVTAVPDPSHARSTGTW
jgi:hypothetical protein